MTAISDRTRIVILTILTAVFLLSFCVAAFAFADGTVNSDLYWSESNEPVFYGATEITLPVGAVDKFDPKDSRFRLFAKDFEDGDLEQSVKVSGEDGVKTDVVGEYTVHYEVTDSHGNTVTKDVKIHVKSAEETQNKITVERTMYTLPSDWNMTAAGFSRCNSGDRQILGIYLPDKQSFEMRLVSDPQATTDEYYTVDKNRVYGVKVSMLNSDVKRESDVILQPASENFVTLQNTVQFGEFTWGNEVQYIPDDGTCVPMVTTPRLKRGGDISTTYTLEIRFDADAVHPLQYYHYQDFGGGKEGEDEFYKRWKASGDELGVTENAAITVLIPIGDLEQVRDTERQNPKNYFTQTLDEHLEYYEQVVQRMDKIIGLEYKTEDPYDQNFRAKYLCKANAHGAGGAYYGTNHIGINAAVKQSDYQCPDGQTRVLVKRGTMYSFFQMNWGGLHELAHGYQGGLGDGSMDLGETSNNILCHYIQMDKTVWTPDWFWLNTLDSDITFNKEHYTLEELVNAFRLGEVELTDEQEKAYENKGFFSTWMGADYWTKLRLYFLIDLFDSFDGADTYAELFSWYRRLRYECGVKGVSYPNQQDCYVLFFAERYDANVLPYFQAWQLDVSDSVQEQAAACSRTFAILGDIAGEKTDSVLDGEGKTLKYALTDDSVSEKYGLTGNVSVTLAIEDKTLVEGKTLLLEKAGEPAYRATVRDGTATLPDVFCGGYMLRAPLVNGYSTEIAYVTVTGDCELKTDYVKQSDYHPTSLHIKGIYNTDGFVLTLSDNNLVGTVHLGLADLGNRSGVWVNQTDVVYCSVNIDAPDGTNVYSKSVYGMEWFSSKIVPDITLTLGYGYTVAVYKAERYDLIDVYSELSGSEITDYAITAATADCTYKYEITEQGLKPLYLENFSVGEALYSAVKEDSDGTLEQLVQYFEQNEDVLDKKYSSASQKERFLQAFNRLKEEDRAPYSDLYERILRGGVPELRLKNSRLTLSEPQHVDWKNQLEAYDPEDGYIVLTDGNFKVETAYDGATAGEFAVKFTVTDSDGNESSAVMQLTVNKPAELPDRDPTGPSDSLSTTDIILIWGGALLALAAAAVTIVLILKRNRR